MELNGIMLGQYNLLNLPAEIIAIIFNSLSVIDLYEIRKIKQFEWIVDNYNQFSSKLQIEIFNVITRSRGSSICNGNGNKHGRIDYYFKYNPSPEIKYQNLPLMYLFNKPERENVGSMSVLCPCSYVGYKSLIKAHTLVKKWCCDILILNTQRIENFPQLKGLKKDIPQCSSYSIGTRPAINLIVIGEDFYFDVDVEVIYVFACSDIRRYLARLPYQLMTDEVLWDLQQHVNNTNYKVYSQLLINIDKKLVNDLNQSQIPYELIL